MKMWLLFLLLLPIPSDAKDKNPPVSRAPAETDVERTKLLDDENPRLRARALAYLTTVTSAQLKKALRDSDSDVRAAALWRAIHDGLPDASELLTLALDDPNPGWQAHATLALLERGVLPPLKHLRSTAIAAEESGFRFLTNPRDGILYRDPKADDFWKALGPVVDEDALAMMQELGVSLRNGTSFTEEHFKPIGRFIAQHPAALKRLTDGDKLLWHAGIVRRVKGITFNVDYADRDRLGNFAIHAAAAAGPAILPTIHPMLRDANFLHRKFAAAVCGRIGDRTSLKPLLEALQQDDGLALGAITTALGRLRSPEAIPALTALYPEINKALSPSSMLGGYSTPVWLRDKELLGKYESNGRPASQENLPKGSDPISPTVVTDAIEQVGPEHAQPFFRSIYKENPTYFSRDAVARCLRPGTESDNAQNVVILLELINEGYGGRPGLTAYAAAVSLLHFNLRDGEAVILHHLEREFGNSNAFKLERLQTVPHAKRAFLDERLRALISTHPTYDSACETLRELLQP